MTIFLIFLVEVIGIASAIHAVMNVRTPQGSIAWAVSLVAMPWLSLPFYWVFGRSKFCGYVKERRADQRAVEEIAEGALKNIERLATDADWQNTAIRGTERLAHLPFSGGNEVELLIDGEAAFTSIFAGIDAAKDYALVQFYIVRADGIGNELKDRLLAAADRGVTVRLLYDGVGSLGLPSEYIEELEAAGVAVSSFHSSKGSGNRFQLNFRNHRKTVVIDGHSAWVGGHNVGDEYLGKDPALGHWRDTHVRITGPAALGAQIAFVEDWRWATDELIENVSWTPVVSERGNAQALAIASGPADDVETAALVFMLSINSATERVWIASPYFVPDDAIVKALMLAALRGVDVRILIPEISDNVFVKLAAYTYFDELQSVGVRFYRYQHGFLHHKVVLIDNFASAIGTANFDNRSFRLNFEKTLVIACEAFATEVKQMFESDFARSQPVDAGELDRKPWWFGVAARVSRLAAPVL